MHMDARGGDLIEYCEWWGSKRRLVQEVVGDALWSREQHLRVAAFGLATAYIILRVKHITTDDCMRGMRLVLCLRG